MEVTLLYFFKEGVLMCGLYSQGGLYSEVVFYTGLTVCGVDTAGKLMIQTFLIIVKPLLN